MAITALQYEPFGSRLNEQRMSAAIKIPVGTANLSMYPVSTDAYYQNPDWKVGFGFMLSDDGVNWTGQTNSSPANGIPGFFAPRIVGGEPGQISADVTINWPLEVDPENSISFGFDGSNRVGKWIRVAATPLGGNPDGGVPLAMVLESFAADGTAVAWDTSTRK